MRQQVPTHFNLGTETEASLYLIRFTEAPIATYRGDVPGYAATTPTVTGERRLNINSPQSRAYRQYLNGRQAAHIGRMQDLIGRSLDPQFQYTNAINGMAVMLTPTEAERVARLPFVEYMSYDIERVLQTDAGPQWIDAPDIWNGTATMGMAGNMGEGIVVGIIDTGINPLNPSFAEVGPVDGYVHTNPKGQFFGVCDPNNTNPPSGTSGYDPSFPCNDKLIGAWGFTSVNGGDPTDYDGHGSHTASTAAGNAVVATVETATLTFDRDIIGVAPHANIIAYSGCCTLSALTASIDQAVADGVDVINYSIGSEAASDVWNDFDTVGFLNARAAGIFVATSAGNSGPGPETVGSPADAPWLTSVGASTHDRKLENALINMSGGSSTPPADIFGKSITSAYGPASIVYAGDFGDALCGPGAFSAGTFSGEIVICDRGEHARVDKGQSVLDGGAGGFILANDEPNGNSLNADAHVLPAVHISFDDGVTLKAWVASGSGHTGEIQGTVLDIDPANGDIMAGFSSRGANRAIDIISPNVTAPGVDIIAAYGAGGVVEWTSISGTSMSSPHTAGAGALLMALHPDWTPAEIQSALMMTGITAVLKEDGTTPADPFDMGSGRIDLSAAGEAGLVMDETEANYLAAEPALGGDPKTLNLASMADSNCVGVCTWTRTVRSTLSTDVDWTVSVDNPTDVTLNVTPSSFTLPAGGTQVITIEAVVAEDSNNEWIFGAITLSADGGEAPDARMPVAVVTTDTADGVPFTAVADAFVGARRPNDNRGSLTVLRIDGNPETNSYLRFDVAGSNGNAINEATLRIFVDSDGAGTGFDVHAISDNSWSETGITYNNAPALGTVLGSSGSISDGNWVEIDVTSHVTGDGLVSFALTTGSTSLISVSSREGGNPPELLVDFDSGPPVDPVLTINTVGNGSVDANPAPPYSTGQQVTLTATPDAGWLFDGWTGDVTSSDNPLVVTMNGDVTVTANFVEDVPPPDPVLTVNIVGNGSVDANPAPPYSEGQQVTLTATPDAGWLFDGWTGDVTSGDNPLVVTMNGDVTVTANFVEDVPPPDPVLTINIVGNGSVDANPAPPYSEGQQVTLTATPDAGWLFDGWTGDVTSSDNPLVVTMNGDVTVTANFVEDVSPPTGTMHVADLDGVNNRVAREWEAIVTVLIVDENGAPVEDATVDGSWSAGDSATSSCTTDSSGLCTVTQTGLTRQNDTAVFTVTNVSHSSLTYEASDNTDPDGDSDGTSITVDRP